MTASRLAAIRLQERDKEILDTLVHRVRVLSLSQIARIWWTAETSSEAYRRVQALCAAGLLRSFSALSHPELTLSAPVVGWFPGDAVPEFGSVSYRLKSRWNSAPIPMRFVIASKGAGRSMGGAGGRFPRESEITHDLHMGTVFLYYRARVKEWVPYWQSEASILRDRGGSKKEKLPDSILHLPDGPQIVEFGGSYSKPKLERFHSYCASLRLPYEVW